MAAAVAGSRYTPLPITSLSEKATISQRDATRRKPTWVTGLTTSDISNLDPRAHRLGQGPHPGTRQDGETGGQRDAARQTPAGRHGGDDERRRELHAAGDVHDDRHCRTPHTSGEQLRKVGAVARPGARPDPGHEHGGET